MELLGENEREPGKGPFTSLKLNSNRMPPLEEYSNLDLFLQLMTNEIEKIAGSPRKIDANLTREEREAFKHLERERGLIIKPADKGGNLVVLDHDSYKKIVLDNLADTRYYGRLPNDPTDGW